MQLLRPTTDVAMCSHAAVALACISRSSSTHQAIEAADGVRWLVHLLQRSDGQSVHAMQAAAALAHLTVSASGTVAAAGGVQPLVHWVRRDAGDDMMPTVSIALCNLAGQHGALVLAAGGLAAVARLLSVSDSLTLVNAARCLQNLAITSPTPLEAQAVAECTAAMVARAFGSDREVSVAAVDAVAAVWRSSAASQQAVQSTLEHLLQDSSSPQPQHTTAAKVLRCLASIEPPVIADR